MSGKRKSFVVALTAAGVLGLGAPMASAGGHVDNDVNSGLVNVNDNQVPIQACNNDVPVNALGVQVPVNDVAGALGIASQGNMAAIDNSCHQGSYQDN